MKTEKSTQSIVSIILLYSVIIFPFFGMLLTYFIKKYTASVLIIDLVNIFLLYLSLRYVLSYIEKKFTLQEPKKAFNYALTIFGVILVLSMMVNIGKNFEFYHLIYTFFYYWVKFIIFHEMTKKYFYKQLPEENMIEYTEINKKDEIMVYCRGCGKEIHETAETCPHCGAPQNIPSTRTNNVALFFVGLGWSIVLWFVSLFMIGFFIGVANPQDGAEIAGKFGEDYGLVLLLLSMILSAVLTKLRILPGTGKKG